MTDEDRIGVLEKQVEELKSVIKSMLLFLVWPTAYDFDQASQDYCWEFQEFKKRMAKL